MAYRISSVAAAAAAETTTGAGQQGGGLGPSSATMSTIKESSDDAGSIGGDGDLLTLHICGAFHCAHGLGIPEAWEFYDKKRRRAARSLSRRSRSGAGRQ